MHPSQLFLAYCCRICTKIKRTEDVGSKITKITPKNFINSQMSKWRNIENHKAYVEH